MNAKIIFSLTCTIAFVAAVTGASTSVYVQDASFVKANNLSHHLIVGQREYGDRLVLKREITKESAWLQIVKHEETFYVDADDKITQVAAWDQKTNGNGATASLLYGGPGVDKVQLRFESKRGHGIRFIVELYARRR